MKLMKYIKKATALTAAAAISVTAAISASAAEDATYFDKTVQRDADGEKIGYASVGSMASGTARQAVYNKMYNFCVNVWNSSSDIAPTTIRFTDGPYDLYVIGAIPVTDLVPGFDYDSCTDEEYENAVKIGFQVLMPFAADYPIFYFLDTYNMPILRTNDGQAVYALLAWDETYASGATRAEYQTKIKDFFGKAPEIVADKETLAEKHVALQKYLMDNMTYSDDDDMEQAFAHNIVGPAVKQNGVCESYARSYGLLCNLADISCVYIDGYVANADGRGNPGGHSWDAVKLDDGKYYGVDVTWDDGNGEAIKKMLDDGDSLEDIREDYRLNYHDGYVFYEFGQGKSRFVAPEGSHTENTYETPDLLGFGYENWVVYAVDQIAGVVRPDYDFYAAGDVNADFTFDMRDLIRLGKYTVDPSANVIAKGAANANGDTTINMQDAVYLQKSLLGYEDSVPGVDVEHYPSRT